MYEKKCHEKYHGVVKQVALPAKHQIFSEADILLSNVQNVNVLLMGKMAHYNQPDQFL